MIHDGLVDTETIASALVTETYRGYTIYVVRDDEAISPRNCFATLSRLVFAPTRHFELDEATVRTVPVSANGWEKWLVRENVQRPIAYVVPLQFMDNGSTFCEIHVEGGVLYSRLQDGMIEDHINGLAVYYCDVLREEWAHIDTSRPIETVLDTNAIHEVETYAEFLNTQHYGYILANQYDEHLDDLFSCESIAYALHEARATLDERLDRATTTKETTL